MHSPFTHLIVFLILCLCLFAVVYLIICLLMSLNAKCTCLLNAVVSQPLTFISCLCCVLLHNSEWVCHEMRPNNNEQSHMNVVLGTTEVFSLNITKKDLISVLTEKSPPQEQPLRTQLPCCVHQFLFCCVYRWSTSFVCCSSSNCSCRCCEREQSPCRR